MRNVSHRYFAPYVNPSRVNPSRIDTTLASLGSNASIAPGVTPFDHPDVVSVPYSGNHAMFWDPKQGCNIY